MGNSKSKEGTSLTEAEMAKAGQFINDLKRSEKRWKGLAASWNVKGKISPKTFIKSMRGMVSQSSGYSTLLKEMEDPMAKSADAYRHFNKLLNNQWMIKNYNEQVTKARLIYHDYSSLLIKTSTTVNKILIESKKAIMAIDSYEKEIKYKSIPDASIINRCLERLTSWHEACEFLKPLQNQFLELGKLASEQQQEWKQIEQARKREFKKYFKWASLCFAGILGVVTVGIALGLTGGAAAIVIGAAYFSYAELAAILALGVIGSGAAIYLGNKSLKKWQEWKECEEARKTSKNISKSIAVVDSYLKEVSAGVVVVEKDLTSIDKAIGSVVATTDSVTGNCNTLEKNLNHKEYAKDLAKDITKDFAKIKTDLKILNNACDKCIEHVEKCQQAVVDIVNKK